MLKKKLLFLSMLSLDLLLACVTLLLYSLSLCEMKTSKILLEITHTFTLIL